MNKKSQKTQKQNRSNLIFGIINISVVVGLAILVIVLVVLSQRKPKVEEKPKRFENLTHITLSQYEAILRGDIFESPDGLEYSNIYVYMYNPDYDACGLCGFFNDDIIRLATKEDALYHFYVLDISAEGNEGIIEKIEGNNLPTIPVFLHIYGQELQETHTNEHSIKSALSKL